MTHPAPQRSGPTAVPPLGRESVSALDRLLQSGDRRDRITHVEHIAERAGDVVGWPAWLPADVIAGFQTAGIAAPWRHQVETAGHAWAGRHVVVATGTASGKSLAYLMPVLTAALHENGTTIYLSPTKALAADQLRALGGLGMDDLRAATIDGDSYDDEREWARRHASIVLTNPDMLHRSLLPAHQRWATVWRRLRYVVIDEAHGYRGVFGAHVAMVIRRLRRVAERHGADPVFVLASATLADPATSAGRLTGLPVEAVTVDGSPRGRLDIALWQPPLVESDGGATAGRVARRSTMTEAADVLADLVCDQVRSVVFVRSRRGAESVALAAQRRLAERAPGLAGKVAAYRAGFLAEERRRLEASLHNGTLLGLASTNALELGVDVKGLDAVVIAGWPGTRTSLWQQAGRAGRGTGDALAVFVARDDPLDTYLVHHPEAIFGAPLEANVFDVDNVCVLAPHLAATASEVPLSLIDAAAYGPAALPVLDALVGEGLLRRRAAGWFWTGRGRACDLTDLRGHGGRPVQICESGTGRLLGTVDAWAADAAVHDGAVYLHQGESFMVDRLDVADAVALVHAEAPEWTTHARTLTHTTIVETVRSELWLDGGVGLHVGVVDVCSQVVSYLRRRISSAEVLGEHPLDLPERELRTAAMWWTIAPSLLADADIDERCLPGALHAAEHAAIGLLPLFATCDRWDLGGLSSALHPDTGLPTVFIYDGHAGGAGFAARGFDRAEDWLRATRDAITNCACETGCPSCVQSPKCGSGNEPLDAGAAARLLAVMLRRRSRVGLASVVGRAQ